MGNVCSSLYNNVRAVHNAISLIICTNPATKSSVKFCVDEVFEDRGFLDVRRRRRDKSSSLGMPKAPQVNIQGDSSV